MPYDVGFAKRRFPNRCEAIDELAARSENFRDLCFDIETAAALKRTWETSNAPERQVRYAECAALVEELEQEIAALLLPEMALQPSFNVGAEPVLTSFQDSEPATPVETGKRWEILASGIMKEAPDKFTTIDDLVQRKVAQLHFKARQTSDQIGRETVRISRPV